MFINMKRFITSLLLASLMMPTMQAQMIYDVNGDGQVNGSDIATLAGIILQSHQTTLTSTSQEGVYSDGTFRYSVSDASRHAVTLLSVEDKSSLTQAAIPTFVTIDNSQYVVTRIEEYAFQECLALTSITIPNSVTSIGKWAFSYCSALTSVEIPLAVKSIEEGTFSGCTGLTSLSIPNSVTSIGDYAFTKCSNLTSITIPNSVTSIGASAFSQCTGLINITLSNSLATIGIWAFYGCTALTSLTFPNTVTTIGDYAFYYCPSLASITLSKSITSIGQSAFAECVALTSVTALRTNPTAYNCANSALSNTASATLHVPTGCTNAYKNSAPWSSFGTIVEDAE